MTYEDILYDKKNGVARLTINRPQVMNAFRGQTLEEMIHALNDAAWDKSIGVVVLAGAGERAFCTGGDQSAHDRKYDGRGIVGLPVEDVQTLIRDLSKPVIARVQGFAIGGGNVMATVCDLTIASEKAVFGQVGPRVGSVDAGFGTAYLAHIVGEKRARELWYLCRRYTAQEAYQMGLVNAVVPHDKLDEEVDKWCAEINQMSPTAISIAKRSFNASTEHIRGITNMAFQSLALYYDTEESREGGKAFKEKRKPDFKRHLK
jgi:2-ketocyclohexanecarboxyl-CoA hydrolase